MDLSRLLVTRHQQTHTMGFTAGDADSDQALQQAASHRSPLSPPSNPQEVAVKIYNIEAQLRIATLANAVWPHTFVSPSADS